MRQSIHTKFAKSLACASIFATLLLFAGRATAQTAVQWSPSGAGSFATGSNWIGGAAPGSTSVATFSVNPTSASSPVTFPTGTTTTGVISVLGARTNGLVFHNAAGVTSTLQLNGETVNGVANTIFSNLTQYSGTAKIDSIGSNATGSLGLSLGTTGGAWIIGGGAGSNTKVGNTTDILSIISGSSSQPITFLGGGNYDPDHSATGYNGAMLELGGVNTFTGGIIVGDNSGSPTYGNSGVLMLDATNTLANVSTNNITINKNSQLYLLNVGTGTFNTSNITLTLNGLGNNANSGALRAKGTAIVWPGNIVVGNASTEITTQGATTVFSVTGTITGPSGYLLQLQGSGELVLTNPNNNWGSTQIGNGTVLVAPGGSFSTGALNMAQTSTNTPVMIFNNPAQTIGGLFGSYNTYAGGSITLTLNGTRLTINQTTNGTFGATSTALPSTITGTGSIVKTGAASLTLINSAASGSLSGGLKISQGELLITPSSAASLTFNMPAPDTLDGGSLGTTGISASGIVSLNVLTVTNSSTIYIDGTNAHQLIFANSSSSNWTSGKMITIAGWTGNYNGGTSGTVGQIFFGTSASGLTAAQLAQIQFFDGTTNHPATLLSTGELVPAPSITTTTAAFGAFCNGVSGSLSVAFTTVGTLTGTYSVQLSNASGSFASPTVIGTGSSSPISATIPAGTAAGTGYLVRVVNSAPAIIGTNNGDNITVIAAPNVYAVTGSGAICPGTTGVDIQLSNSQTGVNYQLYNGASTVGSAMAGTTSDIIDFGSQTAAGVYTVLATSTSTGACTQVMSGSGSVTVNPIPGISISGTTLITPGNTATLNISDTNTYNFGTGDVVNLTDGVNTYSVTMAGGSNTFTTPTLSVTTTYNVTSAYTTLGCSVNVTGQSAIVYVSATPTAIITGATTICPASQGGAADLTFTGTSSGLVNYTDGVNTYSVTLSAGSGGVGTADVVVSPSVTTTYSLINIISSGTYTLTGSATVTISTLPTVYSMTGGGYCAGTSGTNIGLSGSDASSTTYQLYNGSTSVGSPVNGIGGGAISFGVYSTVATTYTVLATNALGCYNAMEGEATVSLNPLPNVYSVTGTGSYCTGNPGIPVGLSGSDNSGTTYQLYEGSSTSGSPIAGSSSSFNFGSTYTTGTYTVLATITATGCTNAMSGSAIITTISVLPAGSISGPLVINTGGSMTLSDPTGTTGGVWSSANTSIGTIGSTGATVTFAAGTTAGTTTISYTLNNTCGTTAASSVITVNAVTTGQVVISQVYGGGGKASALYNTEFVELFNPTGNAVTMTNWSIQYVAAAGGSWAANKFSGTIAAHSYFLIAMASGSVGSALPTPDASPASPSNMNTSNGTLALVADGNPITTTAGDATSQLASQYIVDFVGYGSAVTYLQAVAPAPGSITSIFRGLNGCLNAGNNATDFATPATPNPRNSSSPTNICPTPVAYYSAASGNLDATTTWGTNTDGSGTNPSNFTSELQTFHIANGNPGNFAGSTWTVSGPGSVVNVDEGTDFSIPTTTTVNATINVGAGRTLTISNSTLPTFGDINVTSTIVYSGYSGFSVPTTPTYGNLTFLNTTVTNSTGATLTFSGNLTVSGSSSSFNLLSSTALTLTGTGNQVISANTGDTIRCNAFNCTKTAGNVSLATGTNLTIYGSWTMVMNGGSTNAFSDNGNAVTVGHAIDLSGPSSAYNFTGTLVCYAPAAAAYGAQNILGTQNGPANFPCYAVFNNMLLAGTSPVAFNGGNTVAHHDTIYVRGNLYISSAAAGTGYLKFHQTTIAPGNTIAVGGNFSDSTTSDFVYPGMDLAGSTLMFYGSNNQTYYSAVTGSGANGGNKFRSVTVNKTGGSINLLSSLEVVDSLTLLNGIINTGTNSIQVDTVGHVTANASSYVNGNLYEKVPSGGTTSLMFPVGDATYAPVSLTYSTAVTGGTVEVSSAAGAFSLSATSYLNPANYVSRYWTITDNGTSASSTNVNVALYYNAGDMTGVSNSGYSMREYTTGWATMPSIANSTSGVSPLPADYTTSTGVSGSTYSGNYMVGAPDCLGATGGAASASVTAICGSGTSDLSLTGSSSGPGITYQWQSSTGSGYSAISGATNSTYNTSSISTTTFYNCVVGCQFTSTTATSAAVTVTVNALPTISAGSNVAICNGSSTTLNATGGISYSWTPGTGLSATTGSSVSADPTTLTTYTVTGTDVNSCSNTAAVTVSVNPLPSITSILGPNNICVGSSLQLSDLSSSTSSVWSSSNTSVATVNASTGLISASTVGTTTISYTLTNSFTCTNTVTENITVNQLPTASASNSGIACAGGTVTLNSGATGATGYSWSGPGSFSSTSANPTLTGGALIGGTYSVTVNNSFGCTAMSTTVVTVNTIAVLPTNTSPACAGGTVGLTSGEAGTAIGVTYSWNGPAGFSAGTSGATVNITSTSNAGAYTITATNGLSGCSATATTVVTVSTLTLAPTNSSYACTGGSVNMFSGETGTATGVTYSWSGPLGYTSATNNPVLNPINTAMTGVYSVTTSNTYSGCSATGTTSVTVDTIAASATNSGYACTGGAIDLYSGEYSTAPSVTYAWHGPLGYTSTSSNPVLNPVHESMSGVYTVTASSAGSGCSATSTTAVVADTFNILVSNSSPACVGTSFSLSSTYIGTITPTYSWSGPLGFSSISADTIVTDSAILSMAGAYTLNISASGSGCSVTKTTTVVVNPLPVGITGVLNVCPGLTRTLSDATGGGIWSSANTTMATVGSLTGIVTGVTPGTATIIYTLGTTCSTYTVVTVDPTPAAITGTKSVCIGSITVLSDATAGGSWSSNNSNATIVSGSVQGVTAGTSVISYVSPGGCYSTATVTVNALPGIISGSSTVCESATTTLSDATAGGTWSSSNTSAATIGSTGSTVTLTGAGAGTTTILYTLTTGCNRIYNVTVNPITAILGAPVKVCVGATVTLSDATAGGSWSSSTVAKGTVGASSGAVYGVASGTTTITYTTALGCTAKTVVTVNPISAISGTAAVCQGGTTSLSDVTTGGTWSSSNTGVATVGTSGIVTAGLTVGTSTISYIIASTGCNSSTTVTMNPITPIIGTPGSVCVGSAISLSDATTGGTWSSSTVAKGSVNSSTGTVYGVASGTTTITYLISATGCKSTGVLTVNPISAILGANTMCSASTITLSDATAGGSWTSSNTGAATIGSAGSTVTVTGVSIGGTTTISYATVTGCSSSIILTVNQTPAITGTNRVCVGFVTNLTDNTGNGGTWSSSSSNATVDGSGDVTGAAAGTSTISYTAAIGGCKTTKVVSINANPAAILGGSTLCAVSSITLSDATAGGSWSSSNSDVSVSGSVVSGVSAGTAVITYGLTTGCLATKTLTINASPTAIGGGNILCAGSTLTLTDGVSGGAWTSSNTSVATIVSGSGLLTGITGGTANITYSTASGCAASTTVTVNTILPINGATNACVGNTVSLSDGSAGGTWSTSSTAISLVDTSGLVVTAISVDTATIVYTIPSGCSRSILFNVNAAPTEITGNLLLCAGTTSNLSDDGGGTWSISNDIATVVSSTGVVTASTSLYGTATVTYTAGAGCSTTATLTVAPNPTGIAGAVTECPGATITISDAAIGGSWNSSGDIAVVGAGSTATVTAGSSAGTGTITYTMPTGCSVTLVNTVKPNPSAIFGTMSVCVGGTTVLSDTTSGVVSWTSSNTGIATNTGNNITGISAGSVTITYTINTGCITTTTVTVISAPIISGNSDEVCVGTMIPLAGTGSGTWSSSNSAIATVGTDGTVTTLSGGMATISYTEAGSSGCIAATVVTVNTVGVILGTGTLCSNTTTTLSDVTVGGSWTSGNTSVATVNSSGIVSGVGAGTSIVTYTSLSGCSAMMTMTVTGAPATIDVATSLCGGSTASLSDNTVGGVWSGAGDATVSGSSTTGTIVAGISAGTATVTYTASGCMATAIVSINAQPGSVLGTAVVCAGSMTSLSDLTAGGSWTSTNTSVATVGSAGMINSIEAGTSTISYTLTGGCTSTAVLMVNPAPGAITGPTGVCSGYTISLTDGVSGGNWTASSSLVTVDGSGDVTADSGASGTVIITYSLGSCASTYTVTVTNLPSAILGTTSVCTGLTTNLSNSTSGGVWSSSNTSIATVGSASGVVLGSVAGTTSITYSEGVGCVTSEVVTVYSTPAAITGSTSVCVGSFISLIEGTSGGNWNSSNPAIGAVDGSGHVTGESAGTVTISYIMPGGCYVTSLVTVNALPGSINGITSVCSGSMTSLSDASAGGVWSISGSAATIGSTGIVDGVSTGTATVSYIFSGTGCGVGVIVTVSSTAGTITGNNPVCIGSEITLVDGGGTWTSSNTAVAAIGSASGTLTGESAGTAKITYSLGTCSATTIVTVDAGVAVIKGLLAVCQGATLSLSDATTGGAWTSSNTLIATVGTNGTVTGVTTGSLSPATASISYTNGAGTCNTASVTVTVNPIPGAISSNTSLCPSGTTTLTDATTGGTWSMSNDYATIVGSTGFVTASATLYGTATVTYTLLGCTVKSVITVNPNPTGIGGVTSECAGKTVTMTDATAGGSWTSTGSAAASGTGTAGTIVAGATAGTASVTYTIISTGCYVKATNTIYNNPAPIVGTFTACTGVTDDLTDATSGGVWSSSNTAVATVAGYYLTGHTQGTTTITYQVATGSCYVTQVVSVNLTPTVSAISGPATISHAGGAVTLSDATAGGTWNSSNSTIIELIAGTSTPTVTAEALLTTGTVTISYTVTNGWCSTTVTKSVGAAAASHPDGGGTVNTTTLYAGTAVSLGGEVSGIWSSSDNTIATVDGSGLVTAILPGNVTITHESTNDDGTVTTSATNVVVTAAAASISLVPNPNKGAFVVKGTVGSVSDQVVTLEVTDVLGQVIYKGTTTAFGGKLNETINLSGNLANGMYLLNVTSGTENKTIHFVIAQ